MSKACSREDDEYAYLEVKHVVEARVLFDVDATSQSMVTAICATVFVAVFSAEHKVID